MASYAPYIPTDPNLYYRIIKWLYAHTLARIWWVYRTLSLRETRVIELGSGIGAFRSLWEMAKNNKLDDNCSVRIAGVVSEFVPLVPGAISAIDPRDWESVIDHNVTKLLKTIDNTMTGAALSTKRKFGGDFDPDKASRPERGNEYDMKQYFTYWARALVKHKLFTGTNDVTGLMEHFRSQVKDEIVSSIAKLSAPHGVIRNPTLPDLAEYRYLGLSYDIADYGIPILVKNDVYDACLRKKMVQDKCNADVVMRLKFLPDFPFPSGVPELGRAITAFSPAKFVGFIVNDTQVRSVENPSPLKGRIWASYLFRTDKKDFVIHLPWRTKLSTKGISKNVFELKNFVESFANINGFDSYELIAHFDQAQNWFYEEPRISMTDQDIEKEGKHILSCVR